MRHLEHAGLVVMKRPPISGGAAMGLGFEAWLIPHDAQEPSFEDQTPKGSVRPEGDLPAWCSVRKECAHKRSFHRKQAD